MVTIRTQVKDTVKNQGINNIADGFHEVLNKKVEDIILKACNRAKKNQRKTVMGRDI